jgi:hypothetical protein
MALHQDGLERQIGVPAFLQGMSATRLVRRLKSGRRVDAALVADLSLTQKTQLSVKTAMKPAFQKEIFSGARGSYLLFLCWLVPLNQDERAKGNRYAHLYVHFGSKSQPVRICR